MSRIEICDNSVSLEKLTKDQLVTLSGFAGLPLAELAEKGLIIFPYGLDANRDGIAKQTLFDIVGKSIKTGNAMGFFCVDDLQIAIHSRFDSSDKQYFLHYMLQKVSGLNVLNLKNNMGADEVWEFLLYLFPYCLRKALKQGVFRAYRRYDRNDDKIRGTIDVSRHLKLNIPFNGKVAAHVREYSADNPLTQLIRHTIEFIRNSRQGAIILNNNEDIKNAVSQIIMVTPLYNIQDRQKVIFQNLRKQNHPYFTEYSFLRDLCLKILNHEKISTGQEKQMIQGIVFDGAWLWEEYLATILKKIGFKHPENKTGTGRLYLFTDKTGWIYPDFTGETSVLDAKYKPLDVKDVSRDDRFQIISYMHVLNVQHGYLLFPCQQENIIVESKILKGIGGKTGAISFPVPGCDNWNDFTSDMEYAEEKFRQAILRQINS